MKNRTLIKFLSLAMIAMESCGPAQPESDAMFTLMTLDPGHFHAALVQKEMYPEIEPVVYVFAPGGSDLTNHLGIIEGFNTRGSDPTSWREEVYIGKDYLERMLIEKPGNLVVISGNNEKKTDYISKAVKAGLHVLADKPMVISPGQFPLLERSFQTASDQGVVLYDIMTERFEISTVLQRTLSQEPTVFGELIMGTMAEPAITKESVHHFYKQVAGKPLTRPAWFFDVSKQGDAMVDVGTHLVDLVQWECFPGQILSKNDVEVVDARRWTSVLSREQFERITHQDQYPNYLESSIREDSLYVFANGEIYYRLKGVLAKVSVRWNYEAPEGAGDTHYSIMRGSRSHLVIRQGADQHYKPELYIRLVDPTAEPSDFDKVVAKTLKSAVFSEYPGITMKRVDEREWQIEIPEKYRVGHEAHFSQVTKKYLGFLSGEPIPEWEVPNMIVKYYTTTQALERAMTKTNQ